MTNKQNAECNNARCLMTYGVTGTRRQHILGKVGHKSARDQVTWVLAIVQMDNIGKDTGQSGVTWVIRVIVGSTRCMEQAMTAADSTTTNAFESAPLIPLLNCNY